MRPGLLIALIASLLSACVSIPHSAKQTRMADACAVAALVVGQQARTNPQPVAALTRSPVLTSLPAGLWFRDGVQQPLDLRQCPAVLELGLQSGITLWGPGSPPAGERYYLSDPSFSRDGQNARVTWSGPDARTTGQTYDLKRTLTGWQIDTVTERLVTH